MNFIKKKTHLLVSLILFGAIVSPANASAFASCTIPWKSSDFEDIKTLSRALPTLAAGITFSVLRLDGQWEGCSGSVVSDEGHILTANHCIDKCANDKTPIVSYLDPYQLLNMNLPKASEGQCKIKIDGIETVVDVKVQSCDSKENFEALTKNPRDPERHCVEVNDVAVIIPKISLNNHPCVSTAKDYKVGERIFTVGKPRQTYRGFKDADGKEVYASFGEIIPAQDKCTVIRQSDLRHGTSQPNYILNMPGFSSNSPYRQNLVQTTLNIFSGNSGGPIINQSGEVIGVASMGAGYSDESRHCKGDAFFAPISGISIKSSHLASGFAMESLTCKKNKADTSGR